MNNWTYIPFQHAGISLTTTLPDTTLTFDRFGTPYEDTYSDLPNDINIPTIVNRNITLTKNGLSASVRIYKDTGRVK